MSRINVAPPVKKVVNHEGVKVPAIKAEKMLERITLANMLWENQFYIDDQATADLVPNLVTNSRKEFVEALALAARTKFKLRHMPLLLTRELARSGRLAASALTNVINRPDELGEFLALYWKDGKTPVSNQVKRGLGDAFHKFNEYQFAKWNKNNTNVTLRDVMFLTHPKPRSEEQEALFKRIASNSLETPDTWETQLSSGANKAETFTRLMQERKLGALAFLRNLRNMVQAGVSEDLIRNYAGVVDVTMVLPFRYVAAARIVPQFEDMLENMMLRSLASAEKLPGKTLLLVDVSGSMFGSPLSRKSDLDRFDAAAALAMLAREICDRVDIATFSTDLVKVPPRRGFALREALYSSQAHGGTNLGLALRLIKGKYDRIIVFTDEQSQDRVPPPEKGTKGYIINVAAYVNGINNSAWTTISGFSESVLDYIRAMENEVAFIPEN